MPVKQLLANIAQVLIALGDLQLAIILTTWELDKVEPRGNCILTAIIEENMLSLQVR